LLHRKVSVSEGIRCGKEKENLNAGGKMRVCEKIGGNQVDWTELGEKGLVNWHVKRTAGGSSVPDESGDGRARRVQSIDIAAIQTQC
jgi:hypothetical protein